MTTEHRRYVDHLAACEAVECGSWCQECRDLIRAADCADYRRPTATTVSRQGNARPV